MEHRMGLKSSVLGCDNGQKYAIDSENMLKLVIFRESHWSHLNNVKTWFFFLDSSMQEAFIPDLKLR